MENDTAWYSGKQSIRVSLVCDECGKPFTISRATVHKRDTKGTRLDICTSCNKSAIVKEIWKNRTPEELAELSKKFSTANKTRRPSKKNIYEENRATPNTPQSYNTRSTMKGKHVKIEITAEIGGNRKHEKFVAEYKIPINPHDDHYGVMDFIREYDHFTLRELADMAYISGVEPINEIEDPCDFHNG